MIPGVPGAPEPRMHSRSGYFLVFLYFEIKRKKTGPLKDMQINQFPAASIARAALENIFSIRF